MTIVSDFERGHTFEIMLSEALIGKAPEHFNWAAYYRTFQREVVTPRQLATHIYKGHAFTPVWSEARKESNFISAGHIAFDFDAGDETSSLDYLMSVGSFAWLFASFAYSTPSSTDESPRSRGVFVLEYPIYDPAEYRRAYQAVAWKLATNGSQCDPACKDPLRLYYGSPKCRVVPNWSVLGHAALETVMEEHKAVTKTPVRIARREGLQRVARPSAGLQEAKLSQLYDFVRLAPQNEGHNALLKQARLAGGFIATGSLNEDEAFRALLDGAMARSWSSETDRASYENTIRDGFVYGRSQPLYFEQAASIVGLLR